MRHENILGFIAADIQQRRGVQLHFLINNYHEQGTLQAFLKRNVIDVNGLIGLALSLANGLSHLHMEYIVSGTAVRPAIAHRNITSSSVYVKSDSKKNHAQQFAIHTCNILYRCVFALQDY